MGRDFSFRPRRSPRTVRRRYGGGHERGRWRINTDKKRAEIRRPRSILARPPPQSHGAGHACAGQSRVDAAARSGQRGALTRPRAGAVRRRRPRRSCGAARPRPPAADAALHRRRRRHLPLAPTCPHAPPSPHRQPPPPLPADRRRPQRRRQPRPAAAAVTRAAARLQGGPLSGAGGKRRQGGGGGERQRREPWPAAANPTGRPPADAVRPSTAAR